MGLSTSSCYTVIKYLEDRNGERMDIKRINRRARSNNYNRLIGRIINFIVKNDAVAKEKSRIEFEKIETSNIEGIPILTYIKAVFIN